MKRLKIGMRPLSIIVAVDQKAGFGKAGKIPWNFPEDMKHFKEVTTGSICIMGRKTYEDMYNMIKSRGKPDTTNTENEFSSSPYKENSKNDVILSGRESFVVTSDTDYKPFGATAVRSIRSAIQLLDETDNREIFVIGGYRMFIEALAWPNMIYMTIIKNKQYDCDINFPVGVLNKYRIIDGKETDELYFVTYKWGR